MQYLQKMIWKKRNDLKSEIEISILYTKKALNSLMSNFLLYYYKSNDQNHLVPDQMCKIYFWLYTY